MRRQCALDILGRAACIATVACHVLGMYTHPPAYAYWLKRPAMAPTDDEHTSKRHVGQDKTAKKLIRDFAQHKVSADDMRDTAERMLGDGFRSEQIEAIAKVGGRGTNPKNSKRDLMRHVRKTGEITLPDADVVMVHQVDPSKGGRRVTKAPLSIIFPHKIIAVIAVVYPIVFAAMQGNKPKSDFWDNVSDDAPWFMHHPIREERMFEHRAIPAQAHGDAVRWIKKSSLMVGSFALLLGSLPTWLQVLLIFVIPKVPVYENVVDGIWL